MKAPKIKQSGMILLFVLALMMILSMFALVLSEDTILAIKINDNRWSTLQRNQCAMESLQEIENTLKTSPRNEADCMVEKRFSNEFFNSSEKDGNACGISSTGGLSHYVIETLGSDPLPMLIKPRGSTVGVSFYRITLWTRLLKDPRVLVTQVTEALPLNLSLNNEKLEEDPLGTKTYEEGRQSFRQR